MLCIPSQYKNVKSTLKSNLLGSTYTKDSNFYKEIQEKLSEEIKEYYKQNKSYPKSSINCLKIIFDTDSDNFDLFLIKPNKSPQTYSITINICVFVSKLSNI